MIVVYKSIIEQTKNENISKYQKDEEDIEYSKEED